MSYAATSALFSPYTYIKYRKAVNQLRENRIKRMIYSLPVDAGFHISRININKRGSLKAAS
jgi:hypothetical protein